MSPVTFCRALASDDGLPVSSAPERSADSSRYLESSRISRKLIA
jgi:hypothetical protein